MTLIDQPCMGGPEKMRHLFSGFLMILMLLGLLVTTSCGGGEGGDGGSGILIADFDLEGEEYVADPDSPFELFCKLISGRPAYALPDLGFSSNSYPFNQFTGERNAQDGLEVIVSAPDMTFVAQGLTNATGQVTFSDLPTGFLTLNLTGENGNTYHVPVQVSDNTTSRTLVLIKRNPANGVIEISSKTIHDGNGDGINDDGFSYAMFGRPRNESRGGVVHLHVDGVTRIDANGDGDFTDLGDRTITEADDDGVPSSEGDGDEDNDGELDFDDADIDGDDIPNSSDPDIDGDGIPNSQDDTPNGTSPNDDYDPPYVAEPGDYPGVSYLQNLGTGEVAVHFPKAVDDLSEPVMYIIYYSTTLPIDYKTADFIRFMPVPPGDEDLQADVVGLTSDEEYHFAVRVQDSAQPPNMDFNDKIESILVE